MTSIEAGDSAPDQINNPSQLPSSSKEVNTAGTGSFDYVTIVDERLCCPICRAPMQDPWMSKTCEHFYCYECILQHLTNSDAPGICPCDRSPLSIEKDKKQLVPAPRLVKLLCDELEVRCTTQSDCKWTGQRCHWDRHVKRDCNREVDGTCSHGCGYQGSDAGEHAATECPRRPIYCEACQDCVSFEVVESHKSDCPQGPVTCPHCYDITLARSKLPEHLQRDCPECVMECPHSRYGCQWRGKRRLLRQDHLDFDCIFEPLKGVLDVHENRIMSLETENASLRRDLLDLRGTYEDLESRVNRLTRGVGSPYAQDDANQPISEHLNTLTSQITGLSRSSNRNRVTNEQTLHDVKGELSNVQMMLHDLRGEFMALQHAQYYENAYRHWGGRPAPVQNTSRVASGSDAGSADGKKSEDGDSTTTPSTGTAPTFRPMSMFQPNGMAMGYPFQPYGVQPGPPFGPVNAAGPYGMPPPAFGPRRWSGWPYGFGGSSSPEERSGGFKL